MKGRKICKRCDLDINIEDKAVCLHTFKGLESLEKVFWHFQCYLDWRDESITNRANQVVAASMNKAVGMAGVMLHHLRKEMPEVPEIEVEIIPYDDKQSS